jgi:hypothetical protein
MARLKIHLVLFAALVLAVASSAAARDVYVAPSGSPINDGRIDRPLDLVTALSSASPAQPGDTIWLRGGTYWGPFTSYLNGLATLPICVRQYPGERATLDGALSPTVPTLTVLGAYAMYWGFEITNSDTNRVNGAGSRGTGLDIYGPHTQFINLVVHDAETGIGFWTPAIGAELYGNIIYNNGDDGPDRGHGHSIYVQNDTDTKLIANNILFNSFSFGIHAYTAAGAINNLAIDGNITFNHGMLSLKSGAKSNLLLGGGQVAHHSTISNNYSYYPSGLGRGADIGYTTACDEASVTGNYFVGATSVNLNCTRLVFDGNLAAGTTSGAVTVTYPTNSYYDTRPTGLQQFVRPNLYEPGRANIAVYNWDRQPQVAIDLSQAGLTQGQSYEIRDAENFYGTPVVVFTYSGAPVTIPMTSGPVTPPVGNAPVAPVDTKPEFGAFVLLPRAPVLGGLLANVIVSPSSTAQNRPAMLSWYTSKAVSASFDQGIGPVPPSGFIPLTASTTTTYTLTAIDATGARTTKSATLVVAPDAPPLVTLTSPAPGLAYQAPANLALVADAQDSDGTVTEVSFYAGSTLLGTVSTPPFSWALTGLAAGDYSLTAVALDNRGASTTSAPVSLRVVNATSASATAAFLGTDTTTGGTWKNAYGADGYSLATDGVSYPGYATVALAGASSWVWARQNTTLRALQRAGDASRFAATWFSPTTFDIDVAFVDGAAHQVALYTLDFDKLNRQQAIYVIDAATNTVLDVRIASGFINGQYWVWRLKGHVIIRLSRIAGANAVVSGLFFDPPPGVVGAPVVSLTSPTFGASFTAPAGIPLSAQASAGSGRTIDHVSFYAGPSLVGTATTAPYTFAWTGVPAGTYGVTAVATDSQGVSSTSAALNVVVRTPASNGSGSAATFVRTDATTQGAWKGTYGAEGYSLFAGTTSLPIYAQVTLASASSWIWSGSTNDSRALQKAGTAPDRFAGTLYAASTFTLDVNLLDGLTHQIALYGVDFDALGRQESIDLLDAATGALLDHRLVTAFSGGQYQVWQVTGHVTIRVSNVGGANAVLSGLFFDGAGVTAPPGPPTVTLTSPTVLPATAPATVTLNATVASSSAPVTVTFYDGTTSIGISTSPFTLVWSNVAAGAHTITARATDASGQTGTSNALAITVNSAAPIGGGPSGPSATYVRTDSTTQGTWNGVYGRDGFTLAGGAVAAPSYAQMSFVGQSTWTWASSTTDVRGLQRSSSTTDRLAATWYSSTGFNIDLNLADGSSHAVAVYGVDWDGLARQQRVEIVDAMTGIVLDGQTLSTFSNGGYLIWRLSGHVLIRVTRLQGPNAVLSGIFFDVPTGATPPTIRLTSPTATTTVTAPAVVTVEADAQDVDATIADVTFFAGAIPIGSATSPPYRAFWNVTVPGQYSLTARATNSVGQTTVTAPLTVSVGGSPTGGGASASFVGLDATSGGTWRGRYGTQGYAIAADSNSQPSGVPLMWAGYSSWVWAFSADPRALQRPTGIERIASTWFSSTSFTIDVNVTDGLSHQVALYALDWDNAGRSETIQIVDAANGTVLDSQTVSNFFGGQYSVWRVSGHVTVKVTRTAGVNAVLSALFVDP